jgi:hypothetical protein
MYPNTLFGLIPPYPRTNRIFVAMSFDHRLDQRWTNVLMPAIQSIRNGEGQNLEPYRVDLSKTSDAILTEILTAISESVCIVADITALNELDGRPVRNANVMYEVGLAHAVRLPEEVVLFRSDGAKLDFDISGVRVHSYNPDDNPAQAINFVGETIVDNLKALDARRRTSLRVIAARLTMPAFYVLLQALQSGGKIQHPEAQTFGQVLGSIQRSEAISLLLEVGALKTEFARISPELLERKEIDQTPLLTYTVTPVGHALAGTLTDAMGASQPGLREYISAYLDKTSEKAG